MSEVEPAMTLGVLWRDEFIESFKVCAASRLLIHHPKSGALDILIVSQAFKNTKFAGLDLIQKGCYAWYYSRRAIHLLDSCRESVAAELYNGVLDTGPESEVASIFDNALPPREISSLTRSNFSVIRSAVLELSIFLRIICCRSTSGILSRANASRLSIVRRYCV